MKTPACIFQYLLGVAACLSTGAAISACGSKPPPPPPSSAFLPRSYANEELHHFRTSLDASHPLDVYFSKPGWSELARKLARMLRADQKHLNSVFGVMPPFAFSLVIIDRVAFEQATGTPTWTKAVAHKGRIFVSLDNYEVPDLAGLARSLRHEYTHAAIYLLSGGKCPGWIDEGLALWSEGKQRPSTEPFLAAWLENHPPIPLSDLQGGFLGLDQEKAKIGYAQSLFAVNDLLITYGVKTIGQYFERLRSGENPELAFKKSFGLSTSMFETRLALSLRKWERAHRAQ